jgi:hypothetical protein
LRDVACDPAASRNLSPAAARETGVEQRHIVAVGARWGSRSRWGNRAPNLLRQRGRTDPVRPVRAHRRLPIRTCRQSAAGPETRAATTQPDATSSAENANEESPMAAEQAPEPKPGVADPPAKTQDPAGRPTARKVLAALEEAAIAKRRAAAFPADETPPELPRVGLALSGGGIRSATFCFGLLRGLAQNGLLRRIDYLSTVSGGGYAGAALTRLIRQVGIGPAQDILARSNSSVLEWLRRNGRYLSPRGARDIGMAVATYLRSGVAAHADLAVVSLLLGVIVILPHALHSDFALVMHEAWTGWASAWWAAALAVWMTLAPSTLPPYWAMRDRALGVDVKEGAAQGSAWPGLREILIMLVIGAAAIAIGVVLWKFAQFPLPSPTFLFFAELFLIGTTLRYVSLLARLAWPSKEAVNTRYARQRNRLTRALRRANLVALVLFALGAVDLLTWEVKLALHEGGHWLIGGLSLGTALVIARAFNDPLQKMAAASDGPQSRWIPQLLNVFGIVIGAIVFCAWVVVVQWAAFSDSTQGTQTSALTVFSNLQYWMRAALIGLLALAWIALTSVHRDTANASSLHNFYRARLVRAYLAVANPERFGDAIDGAGGTAAKRDVTEVIAGDDNQMVHHTPEQQGGPIHLIGTCLNQTREAASGLYNADRKGLPATISARGIEIGTDEFIPAENLLDYGTLGRWTAISGAAASPGAGAYTTRGWAALLFMLGARLGFWFQPFKASGSSGSTAARGLRRVKSWFATTKFGLLASEALASFAGTDRPWWYLSDGGHFDNTGVHALLQRKLDFIILADCGADAKFEYADIENLVRKARIDFDADIEFYSDDTLASHLPLLKGEQIGVLSPERLSHNYTERGVLLARICYCRSQPACRKVGTLLVIKPNLHVALDGDVLAYARRNPTFPHQSTGDQFFDEAQWESHHRLGEDFGRAMTGEWLDCVPGWSTPIALPERIEPLRQPPRKNRDADGTSPVAFWKPETKAAAIGATLGIGALGTLMLPLFQVYDTLKTRMSETESRTMAALDESAQAFVDVKTGELRALGDLKPEALNNLRVIRDTARKGGVSRAVQARATKVLSKIEAVCSATETEFSQCEAVVQPICAELCRPRTDDYWRPSPQWSLYDNPIVQWLGVKRPMQAVAAEDYWQVAAVQATQEFPDLPMTSSDTGATESQQVLPGTELPAGDEADPATATAAADDAGELVDAVEIDDSDAVETSAATATESPPAGASPAPMAQLDACLDGAAPMILYVQVYDQQMIESVRAFEPSVLFEGAVRVPAVENVARSATLRGEAPPAKWPRPTLLVHRRDVAADKDCAKAIATVIAPHVAKLYEGDRAIVEVRDLPASLATKRHVIELWLPPVAAKAE